jgi:streptomycin 6-kinase
LLLERLSPGTMLSTLENDEQATTIAVTVMQQLWRPVPTQHSFPSTAKWAAGLQRLRVQFDGGYGPFPPQLVETAEALFADLFASQDTTCLLHGDLHHYNILRAEREPWLAIDPKGVTGEPAYEVGALLRNPWPGLLEGTDPERVLSRRVDQLAEELSLDRQRLLMWGTAQAVLSAWWNYEDFQGGYEWALECARILLHLL